VRRVTKQQPAGRSLRAIVFTDLDGTLLDEQTYGCLPARPALAALGARDIPIVFASSKTRAEILHLQERLAVTGPFISENGGAVFLSGDKNLAGWFPKRLGGLPARTFGASYQSLRKTLVELRLTFRLELVGFGDVAVEVISEWTGLSRESAALAHSRDFDEPFLWRPEPDPATENAVRAWLAERGLRLSRGGRFWHLTGNNDKGVAATWLLATLARAWGERPVSLGLGDSENDLSLLAATDEGALVERPGGGHLEPRPPTIRTVSGVGPEGWGRAVLDWLSRLSH
jgi:mannosyl-3-phosphoglycerate phosphatase